MLVYQGRWTRGVIGGLASSGENGGHFVPGEVACVEMGPHHSREQAMLVLQFRCYRLLLRTAVRALLHGSQNPGLLTFGHAAESHRCNQKRMIRGLDVLRSSYVARAKGRTTINS